MVFTEKWIAVRYPFAIGIDDYTKRLRFYIEHTMKEIPMCIDKIDCQMGFIRSDEAGKFLAYLVDKDFTGAVNGSSYWTISLKEILQYVEQKTGRIASLSDSGEEAPYNGEPEYSINTEVAAFCSLVFLGLRNFRGGTAMKNFYILTDALEYIEKNICKDFHSREVADHCGGSLSSLQKLFRLALNRSVKDYIQRRRICLAARDILDTKMKIIDIAYKYQFGSPQSFTRAFKKVWNESPVSYRSSWRFSGICPRLDYHYQEGADEEMARRKVDIGEAYDKIVKMKGTHVICFDIIGMVQINEISFEAGDVAIVESLKRIDRVAGDDMIMLRIGADEFALITGSKDLSYAETLSDKVLCHNGECIPWEKQKVPLSLRAGIIQVPSENLKYDDFFTGMHKAIEESRRQERTSQ